MKNKWMKKLCKNVIGFTVFLAVTITHSSLTHGSDIICFNMLNEDSVSENEMEEEFDVNSETVNQEGNDDCTEDIAQENEVDTLGYGLDENDLAYYKRNHPSNCTVYKTIDVGTWKFNQSFARGELFRTLDSERANPSNWWLCTNKLGQPVTTKSVTLTNPHYTYDYNLEALAMQRCIEVMINYGHTRPCGCGYAEVITKASDEFLKYGKGFAAEMNGCFGVNAQNIVETYMEDTRTPAAYNYHYEYLFEKSKTGQPPTYRDENFFMNFGSQGHRQIILNDSYTRIGIACIERTDGTMWTEMLVTTDIPYAEYKNTPTPCYDGYKEMTVEIMRGYRMYGVNVERDISDIDIYSRSELNISRAEIKRNVGDSIPLSQVYMGESRVALTTAANMSQEWTSSNPSVAIYDKATQSVKCLKPGTAIFSDTDPTHYYQPSPNSNDVVKAQFYVLVTGQDEEEVEEPSVTPTPNPTVTNTPTPTNTDDSYENSLGKLELYVYKKTYKAKTLKKGKKSFYISPSCDNAITYTYAVTKGKKTVKVSKDGKVTVKKGAKKGTYQVKVTAKGYNGETRTKLVTVRVK